MLHGTQNPGSAVEYEKPMFLVDETKSIFDTIAEYWKIILGICGALAIIWRATRKTKETGISIFKRVKSFTDTAQAIADLRVSFEQGITDIKTENEKQLNEIKREHSLVIARLEIMSDTFLSPQFRA